MRDEVTREMAVEAAKTLRCEEPCLDGCECSLCTVVGYLLQPHPAASDCMECGMCHDCIVRTMEASHAAQIEELEQEGKRVVTAFLSQLGDVIRRIGPARRPDDIKASLETIYNQYARRTSSGIPTQHRPVAE